MNTGAGVRSLEALKDWYSSVANFREEAQNALISLSMAVQNAHNWLDEQQGEWQRAIRQAEDEVAQARIELVRLQQQRFFGEQPDTTVQEQILRRARAYLEFCEERLVAVRHWKVKLPQVVQDIYDGPVRTVEFFLQADLVRALALLDRQLGALEQYLGLKPPVRPTASEPPPPANATAKKEPS